MKLSEKQEITKLINYLFEENINEYLECLNTLNKRLENLEKKLEKTNELLRKKNEIDYM